MTTLTFQNTTLSVINQRNQIWLSISDIANALGYKETNGVTRLYNAHTDEFTPNMTALIDMRTNGGVQKVRIFSLRGCHLIGMLSHTKVAKDFRKWVLDVLDEEIAKNSTALATPYLTPEEQQQVQQAVSITHHRTGLSYAEIYGRIKAKFKVAKYDQLLSAQLLDVLQFIAAMNARLPSPDEVLISINTLEALVKCCRLAKQHGEQLEPAMKTIFDMLGVERYSRNQFAARAYDLAHEFNVWINEAERLLAEKGIHLPQLRQF